LCISVYLEYLALVTIFHGENCYSLSLDKVTEHIKYG
jgi:hypothetical protein